jgi:hypothetical protein
VCSGTVAPTSRFAELGGPEVRPLEIGPL